MSECDQENKTLF